MAVTVQLEYEGVSSYNLHSVKIKFFNGGPNQRPSANKVGNIFAIYDSNGTKHWQYNKIVPYTITDYLWSRGVPFVISAKVWVQPGKEAEFYVKTCDVSDIFNLYSAESNRITIKSADINVTPILATANTVTVDFNLRNPHDENLCLSDMDDKPTYYDIKTDENYWVKQSVLEMKPNSRRDLSYGLINPVDNSYVASPKIKEIATTYTAQIKPEFKVSVGNGIWVISWPGTEDPNYPTGVGVKRTDIIEVYSRWTDPYKDHLVYTKSGIDFTKPGSWTFTFDGMLRIELGCKVTGLWDSTCKETTYSQILSSRLYFGNANHDPIPENEGITVIPVVDTGTIGYVKIEDKYRRVRNAFIKIDGKYVPVRVVYYKQRSHYSPKWGDWKYIN